MGLYGKNPLDKYTPKTLSLQTVHKHLGRRAISLYERKAAITALKDAGYKSKFIEDTLRKHQELSLDELHKVTAALQEAKIGAFGRINNTKDTFKKIIRQEAIKNRNVARVRGENMHDALMEQLGDSKTSPKSSSSKPRPTKLGF